MSRTLGGASAPVSASTVLLASACLARGFHKASVTEAVTFEKGGLTNAQRHGRPRVFPSWVGDQALESAREGTAAYR